MTTTETRKAKILVVEDEENVRDLLCYLLDGAGYLTRRSPDGRQGLRTFFSWRPDLVLLDVLMPEMDGWTLLRRVREMSEVPVIMLTALEREDDKVGALRSGADDYLVKPIGRNELLARVNAVLRRTGRISGQDHVYSDAALQLDFEQHRVFVRGLEVHLSPLEFRLLAALVRNAGAVLTPGRLVETCWGEKPAGPANVRVYINFLRKKLEEDSTKPKLIETVREFGYRYRAPREDA